MAADRVAILGAGSVGCFIGRKRIADDIATHGLTVSDYSGWHRHFEPAEVDYATGPERLGEAEIIALCVKSAATADAARDIAAHARDGALVISFQNGISNVAVLEAELGDRFAVVRGMVPYNCAYLGEGRFHKGVAGASLYAEDRPETRAVAERIGPGPAALQLADDMLGIAWGKLLINLNNAVNALSGRPLRAEISERDYRRVFAAAMREGLRLLKRAGIQPAKVGPVPPRLLPYVIGSPDWLFNRVFIKGWKIDSKARSSMSDDLAHGRRTEVDYINGELVRLAESLGAPAPVNSAIVRLIRLAEAGADAWPPAMLRREVLGR